MSIINEPTVELGKGKLKKLTQKSSEKKSARSISSSERPKSEFEVDAVKFIHSLIDGLSAKPVKAPIK